MPETGWSLHPQLAADTAPVGDLALSRLLAINDADYPWLILVPRRLGVTEIVELGADAARLMDEITQVSRVLKNVTGCDKLNIGAIGNVVPQLHVHVVARWKGDRLWPKPVWGFGPPRAGDAAAFGGFFAKICKGLGR
ncbi:MAG TPA: HIT family protein [Xanthobacteraceae bacterium]|nr:HIT family protein [Xanthobacteraceae bacterium]